MNIMYYESNTEGMMFMKITINTFGFDLSNDVSDYTTQKINKLKKYFTKSCTAHAILRKTKRAYIAEITIYVGGDIYRGECSSEKYNLYAAINDSVACIEKQIRKYKSILKKQKKQYIIMPDDNEDNDTVEFEIARHKTLKLKPMTSDEAILQMHMTNHNWFMFLDANTNAISVVYYRHNGGYGIMHAEI